MGQCAFWQAQAFRSLGAIAAILAQTFADDGGLKGLGGGFQVSDIIGRRYARDGFGFHEGHGRLRGVCKQIVQAQDFRLNVVTGRGLQTGQFDDVAQFPDIAREVGSRPAHSGHGC